MNALAQELIRDNEVTRATDGLLKIAIDQHLRNLGAETVRAGGDALGLFRRNPITMGALSGALIGGSTNALAAQEGEDRMARFKRGAVGGAAAGALTGLVAGGGVGNIGRMGEELSHQVGQIRGDQTRIGLDVAPGGVGKALSRGLSRSSRRGIYGSSRTAGTTDSLRTLWKENDHIRNLLKTETDPAKRSDYAKHLFRNERAISNTQGTFGYMGAGESALGLAGISAAGGLVGEHYMNKESSARVGRALDKLANAGLLGTIGNAVGKANPAMIMGAGGALVGAGAAGEGNRIGGALAGGVLGAGLGHGASTGALGTRAQGFAKSLQTGAQNLGQRISNMGTPAMPGSGALSTTVATPGV